MDAEQISVEYALQLRNIARSNPLSNYSMMACAFSLRSRD